MTTALVTGAAGFIGRNVCRRLSGQGYKVIGIDNFSRPSARWFREIAWDEPHEMYCADLQDIDDLILPCPEVVFHLAAQTTVTRSYTSPRADWSSNVDATVALVDWCNRQAQKPRLIYSSTNKVYGDLEGQSEPVRDDHPVDPVTPYGVSKYVAELYIREHYKCWLVFRQSCIYGGEQNGTEDQGWVSHVARTIASGGTVTCFGDGTQVRDLLHVDSLIDLYFHAMSWWNNSTLNIGGGPEQAFSFKEIVQMFGGRSIVYKPARPHDQKYFVSANEGAMDLGWKPTVCDPAEVLCAKVKHHSRQD